MLKESFTPLLKKKCEADVQRWSSLPLSLAGRIGLVLYLFQDIQVLLKKQFFADLDKLISSFIWSNGPASIRKAVLQLPWGIFHSPTSHSTTGLVIFYTGCIIQMMILLFEQLSASHCILLYALNCHCPSPSVQIQ